MPLGESGAGCRSGSPARSRRSSPPLPEDRRPTRLAIEPGRALVARAGWLVASVLHVRERGGRQVVIDAGMTELIRPALYGARHPIVALTSLGRSIAPDEPAALEPARVEGPICESTDALGIHDLPPLRRGDLVAISDAGAYARVAGVDLQRPAACPAGPGRHGRSAAARPPRTVVIRAQDGRHDPPSISDRRARDAWCGCSRSRPVSRRPPSPAPSAPPPGPPFPAPEVDRAVYDYAGILSPEAIAAAEADDRRDRGADGRRGRRLHPGQRRASRRPRRPRRRRAR